MGEALNNQHSTLGDDLLTWSEVCAIAHAADPDYQANEMEPWEEAAWDAAFAGVVDTEWTPLK